MDPVTLKLTAFRHGHALVTYVTRLMPGSLAALHDPSDVVQDVYLEAMRRPSEFRANDDDHARRWLKTIARHRVIDLLRHHESARRADGAGLPLVRGGSGGASSSTEALLEEIVRYNRTPSHSAAAHEIVDIVNANIAGLPAHYAQVLRLIYVEGVSVEVVAARLGRTEKSVNHLCLRAIAELRQRLRSSLSQN